MTWPNANKYCRELGGHLATSTSEEKNQFLTNLAEKNTVWLAGAAVGSWRSGNNIYTNSLWLWTNGEAWNYNNWSSGEPSNASLIEYYLSLLNTGYWNDAHEDNKYYFICEWDYLIPQIPINSQQPLLTLSVTSTGQLVLSCPKWDSGKLRSHTSEKTLTSNTFQHVAIRVINNMVRVYIDAEEVISIPITRTDILEPTTIILGGYYGYMDEFMLSADAGSNKFDVPTNTHYQFQELSLNPTISNYGTGANGVLIQQQNGKINSYSAVSAITPDNRTLRTEGLVGQTTTSFAGHSFKLIKKALTWSDAQTFCELLGGHLATCTSTTKNVFLQQIVEGGVIWLGGTDETKEGDWHWITGEEWHYSRWNSGEPNGGKVENHLIQHANGTWADVNKEAAYWFVCEWDDIREVDPKTQFGVYHYDGHTFKEFDSYVTWADAKTLCEALGGHLATSTNAMKHLFLRTIAQTNSWLGGTNETEDGSWRWVTSEGWDYTNWPSGQPDNINDSEHYLWMDTAGNWYDSNASTQLGFICEWDDIRPPELYYYGGHTFRLFNINYVTYEQAQAYCKSLGGHLATSTNEEKNTFLRAIAHDSNTSKQAWMGGTSRFGYWKWITGEIWDYMKTDFSISESDTNQYSLTMYTYDGNWSYEYNNSSARLHYFFCEWDDQNDDRSRRTDFTYFNPTLTVGDEVMIHITRSRSNTNLDYPYSGLYTFARIAGIDGANITLDRAITTENGDSFTLSNELLTEYYVQIITVPNFSNLTINSGVQITPITWTVETGGGIVAFRCTGDCTVNGSIITSGYGVARCDFTTMEHSKLIDRFLCASGGGVFITCGGTFTAGENARLGATWSGLGSDAAGNAAGYGGDGGAYSNTTTNKSKVGKGSIGSGGGVSQKNTTGNAGANGRGGNGQRGSDNQTYICTVPGSGGSISRATINGVSAYYRSTLAAGNYTSSSTSVYVSIGGGGGGGAPGGNGGNGVGGARWRFQKDSGGWSRGIDYTGGTPTTGGISGSCLILISNKAKLSSASISTGGASVITYPASEFVVSAGRTTFYGGTGGGGGTGFCYIATRELVDA